MAAAKLACELMEPKPGARLVKVPDAVKAAWIQMQQIYETHRQ
jgi:hypothetical protein